MYKKICSLNFKLGMKFADAVIEVCQKGKMPIGSVDFIGSHGQTIWHQPKQEANLVSSTLQIGEPSVVAFRTGIKVVSNFRVMDVAAGGQGAPLVPYSEWLLYRDQNKNRVFQNIGGIGNLTYLPKNGQPNEIQAFDTGPGNMIIDYACQKLFGLQFDEDGKIAASGKINQDMLKECMSHPFLLKKSAKNYGTRRIWSTIC
ncbi:anhydro-N-acetylmuramic acid kinase [Lactococcus fujiensis]|uniref:anhydro-N-acetylmuramic acid kinase n=1 Tax=Lactococcus fujiensis TaxID=610251 RepID=UPI000A79CCBC|nr:anhydro-N-acetylmuramic acid kinase [Lactococcus fujiensis]